MGTKTNDLGKTQAMGPFILYYLQEYFTTNI